jgi:hypothetical protein
MIQIPMSEAQFVSATTRLRSNGIELPGRSGTLTKDGVTANYNYADEKLTIEIIDRPSYYPLALVEAKLQSYLEQSVAYDASRQTS